MLRTQISLTVDERRVLDAEAVRTGRSISALIRDAVEVVYGSRTSADDLTAMRAAFGTWSDRDAADGEVDGATWVELRRSGARLTRREQ